MNDQGMRTVRLGVLQNITDVSHPVVGYWNTIFLRRLLQEVKAVWMVLEWHSCVAPNWT